MDKVDKILTEMQKKSWVNLDWIINILNVHDFELKTDIAEALRQTAKEQRNYCIKSILKYCSKNNKETLEKDEIIKLIVESKLPANDFNGDYP